VAEIAKRHGGGGHPNAAGFIEYLDGTERPKAPELPAAES
jgi:nanoRNase/pAp phosphatase (c-di-AMP/oligoRNAs hydrolase)